MPTTFINPFDFKTIYVNYFLGTTDLLIYALIILVSLLCAKYQMSNKVYFTILILSSLILASFLGHSLYVLIILLIGLISFKGIGSMIT